MYKRLYKNFKITLFIILLANLILIVPTWTLGIMIDYDTGRGTDIYKDLIVIVSMNVATISFLTGLLFIINPIDD